MNTPLLMWMPGSGEWLLIFFAILVLFGAKKLPELARSLGRSLGEFKKGKEEGEKLVSGEPTKTEEKKDDAK